MSSACCSRDTRKMPTGTARSCPSARLVPWRPYNSATSLQVTAAALAGMIWAMENPNRGMVEPDDMDYQRPLQICLPYLGPVVGKYTDWTPLASARRAVCRRPRSIRPLAIQEHSGGLSAIADGGHREGGRASRQLDA